MPFIYKITNTINGKAYIGKTIHSIERRWYEHCWDVNKTNHKLPPLQCAIAKYGAENFTIEQIEHCSTEVVNEREIYWIKYFNTYNHGYNATLGGEGNMLIDRDVVIEVFCLTDNVVITAEILGIGRQSVRFILDDAGFPQTSISKATSQSHGTPVSMFTTTGEYIRSFDTMSLAAEYCVQQGLAKNKHSGTSRIFDVCKGNSPNAFGYKWEYMIPEDYLNEDAYW